ASPSTMRPPGFGRYTRLAPNAIANRTPMPAIVRPGCRSGAVSHRLTAVPSRPPRRPVRPTSVGGESSERFGPQRMSALRTFPKDVVDRLEDRCRRDPGEAVRRVADAARRREPDPIARGAGQVDSNDAIVGT